MKRLLQSMICCLAILTGSPSLALDPPPSEATAKAEVLATVDRFMAAISSNDAAVLEELYLPQADVVLIRHDQDGTRKFRTRSSATDVSQIRAETRKLHERYWNPTVLVHGGIALFWAPYEFLVDGKRSHCGIDALDLIQVDGKWRIASVMYTVEPQGCPQE